MCVIDPISGLSEVECAVIENGWLNGTTRWDKVFYRETRYGVLTLRLPYNGYIEILKRARSKEPAADKG